MKEIIALFPQPLGRFHVDPGPWRDLLRSEPMERRQYHWYSRDNQILQHYGDLKHEIQSCIDQFAGEIMGFQDPLEITISWLNESRQGDSTHQHQHPNSVLSACWYWDLAAPTEIHFHPQPTGSLGTWVIKVESQHTLWQPDSTAISVAQGDLLIWPSYLQHSVPDHRGPGTRRSLALNTMPCRPWGRDLYAVPDPEK